VNETVLIAAAVILLISVLASKISDRFGVPVLLLFLILGMLAGSDGIGGIYFDDPALAQSIGVIALVLILFSGGLDTVWNSARPVFRVGLLLSTLGVLLTAITLGLFVRWLLGFNLLEAFLRRSDERGFNLACPPNEGEVLPEPGRGGSLRGETRPDSAPANGFPEKDPSYFLTTY
jgi:NhaP-type Na+/H+ and K+/H+ antiporter